MLLILEIELVFEYFCLLCFDVYFLLQAGIQSDEGLAFLLEFLELHVCLGELSYSVLVQDGFLVT